MTFINNFAFFWIGEDITIPKYLVNSINNCYKNQVNIYMLTNNRTPHINGVTKTIRSLLPKEIMLARLKAYSKIKNADQVIFLDADSLVLGKIEKINTDKSLILFRREKDGKILNHEYPEIYPEFENKTGDEMMPFLFGAIITNGINSYKKFLTLYDIAKQLPQRFHRWYGDQYALKIATEKTLIDFYEKDFNDYIHIIKNQEDFKEIKKSLVTFKGTKSKELILQLYNSFFTDESN